MSFKIRRAYDGSQERVMKSFELPTRTKQAMKDEVNINYIMAKYKQTGMIDHMNANPGLYQDVSDISDYQEALEKVSLAEDAFLGLSAKVRRHFNNDPAEFLAAWQDSSRLQELQDLGLLTLRPGQNDEPPAEPESPPPAGSEPEG